MSPRPMPCARLTALLVAALLAAGTVHIPVARAAASSPAKPGAARAASAAAESITHHKITVGGKPLAYTVTTGKLPIKPTLYCRIIEASSVLSMPLPVTSHASSCSVVSVRWPPNSIRKRS